jgi:hypothetical protein
MNDDPWAGSLEPRPNEGQLAIRAILGPAAPVSGSQAFPVSCEDGSRWYAKAPNNPQGPRVLVTEYLVSEAGQLIGAPVCEVKPLTIPEAFAGYQVLNGPVLTAGVASGSREIRDAREMRPTLEHRDRDDNARRHAGVFALFDWCWGDDQQWLRVETADQMLYSHDHGFYLPPGGQDWTTASLQANVDVEHSLGLPADGLDVDELERLADALDALDAASLRPLLATVPVVWPVSDDELKEVGRFLERRARQVARRMRDMRAKLI